LADALVGLLGNAEVKSQCTYACPVVFALTIHAAFGGWTPPRNLDVSLTMTLESLDSAPDGDTGPLPGFRRSRTCKGLNLTDDMIDSVHIYWNHDAKRFGE